MHHSLALYAVLLIAGFISSFIDSTVGGGGLISLPTFLAVGLPPALSLGTNKLAGSLSSVTSSLSYLKSGRVTLPLVKLLFPLSLLGSILGADVARHLSADFLRPLVVILLIAVTIYTLVRRDVGKKGTFGGITRRLIIAGMGFALCIGFYDGFFGPGTGSFLIILFVIMGFDFVEGAGNAKVLNFASNIGALCTFALQGAVNYQYGLIMGIGMVIGAVVGSQMAIRNGVRYVKPIFIAVTILLIGKQMLSLWHG